MAEPRPILAAGRITQSLSDRIDAIAQRTSNSRSEVIFRALRNGVEDLDQITTKMENPAINLGFKIASLLADDPAEHAEVAKQLNAIAEHRRMKNQPPLPGLAS